MDSWKDRETVGVIKDYCDKVKQLVARLGIPATHSAVITDGDPAVPWSDYWSAGRGLANLVSDLPVT